MPDAHIKTEGRLRSRCHAFGVLGEVVRLPFARNLPTVPTRRRTANIHRFGWPSFLLCCQIEAVSRAGNNWRDDSRAKVTLKSQGEQEETQGNL